MSIETFRREVQVATEHRGGIKLQPCLALDPAWFGAIQEEVRGLLRERAPSDVTSQAHPTHWTNPYGKAVQYSLFNASGDTSDSSVDSDHKHEGKSFNATGCQALQRFFSCFESRALNLRLNGLLPDSGLSPHEECILHGDRLRLRFHLPVFTNDKSSLVLDEERFRVREGFVYYFNNGCVHAAENGGGEERFHLLFDLFLDEWTWENVLDLDSPATPAPGLKKVLPADADQLMPSEPCRIDEYIIGTLTGLVLKAQRQRNEKGEETWIKTPLNA